MCGYCGIRDETITHVLAECSQLAQNEYKKIRHDEIAVMIHWDICKKFDFHGTGKSYEHVVDEKSRVLENDEAKKFCGTFQSRWKRLYTTNQVS